ncbi:hypothetical protein DFP73DRAFT_535570, partial [Morchella snyderi]
MTSNGCLEAVINMACCLALFPFASSQEPSSTIAGGAQVLNTSGCQKNTANVSSPNAPALCGLEMPRDHERPCQGEQSGLFTALAPID